MPRSERIAYPQFEATNSANAEPYRTLSGDVS